MSSYKPTKGQEYNRKVDGGTIEVRCGVMWGEEIVKPTAIRTPTLKECSKTKRQSSRGGKVEGEEVEP